MHWMDIAKVLSMRHEGRRLRVYLDSHGIPSIGYGRNLQDKGITPEEAELLLDNDLRDAAADARAVFGEPFEGLSGMRKAVLVDMALNLGRKRLGGFRKTVAAVRAGDHAGVVREMMDSEWARDDVPSRAEDPAMIYEHGGD